MNKTFLGLAGAAAMAFGAALTVSNPASATIPSCTTIDTIGEWRDSVADSCIIGDKKFTFVDSDFPTTSDSNFDVDFQATGLTYSFLGTQDVEGPATGWLKYIITVLDPAYKITLVELDSELTGSPTARAGSSVTKQIFDDSFSGGDLLDTLVSTNGNSDQSIALYNSQLYIKDSINILSGATLTGFNNSFTQSPANVPEPASLVIFGAALAGLGLARRRRQA